MELRQTLQVKLALKPTLQLQQAIKLLQLNRLELVALVRQELAENPVLEETSGMVPEEVPMASLEAAAPEKPAEKDDDFDLRKTLEEIRDMGPLPGGVTRRDEELPPFEANVTRRENLPEHLMWQARMSRMSEDDLKIAAEIIGNLDENGYLKPEGLDAVCLLTSSTPEQVHAVRRRIMEFDPVGVAAVTLEECLSVQARLLCPDNQLVQTIVNAHLPELVGRNVVGLAQRLGVSQEAFEEARTIITSLDPKPGRNFGAEEPQYVIPDVYIIREGDDYIVRLNEDGLPKLRLSAYYLSLLERGVGAEARDYLKRKVKSGLWFVKSIYQRQSTVRLVAASIVKFQRDFLDRGVNFLKPLVLRDVADDIRMHESTISRVTSNKWVHTPQGIFPMKFFFNPRIESATGEDLASGAVKEKIRTLVAGEDLRNPLSDQQIVRLLAVQGLKVARRTVAKYRGQLNILPSSKRVKL